ncbi:MAG: peptidase [Ilumatobacteraceae bacterium]|nr:peptidase [Ilumatobacteraceae bacterium]
MGKDIPLGRIFGIKLGMDVTVFLFAAFISVTLATAQLPGLSRGHEEYAYWIAGIGGALFLFLSLLVHEIGHALVAQDEGIGVESMGLTLLGGVTRMESSPTTPGAEFRVSVVGPIASAACGVVFLVGAFLLPDSGTWDLVGALFFWAGYVNIFLAVLNMVPAAPLDGGKVLSSIIWRATNSQATAMLWSGAAGIVAGMALATWGLRNLSRGGATFGWFNVIVGFFVAWSAFQQVRSAPLYKALEGLSVTDAMAAGPPTAASWSTVGEFLRTSFPRPEHQAYPVVGPDGQVSGLLTAAAIRAVPPESWDQLPVAALAYPLDRVTLVAADEQLIPALQKVEGADVRHAMVTAPDGRIIGTLDPSALDRAVHARRQHPTPV